MTKYLEIGQIVNTFGIKGMVKVKPYTDDVKKRFDNLKKVYIQKWYILFFFCMIIIFLKFKGIENPEDANLLRNYYLVVDRDKEEPLEEGTYYIVDMIGLEVYTDDGEKLGILDDVFNWGSSDIYVVKNELGKQILLPAIEDVIKNIDMEQRKMIVHLIPGLM